MILENYVLYELQYKDELKKLLKSQLYVKPEDSRSNVGYKINEPFMKTIFHGFPFITSVNTPVRMAFEEMWFFLRGETNSKKLEEKGINFWKLNTSREFLDSRGLVDLPEGSMGKSYGYQFRHPDYDQLEKLVSGLYNDPFSRRHIITLWNPQELDEMPLTPCWHTSQFYVDEFKGKKYLHLYLQNRSLDVLFGMNYAVSQYRMLQASLAEIIGFELGQLTYSSVIPHLYDNQIEYTEEIVQRDISLSNPKLEINLEKADTPKEALDNLLNMEWNNHIKVIDYEYNKNPIKTPRPLMVA